jgi:hypothetical protein
MQDSIAAYADCLKRVVFPDTCRIPVLRLTYRLNAKGAPGMPERLTGVAEVLGDWLLFLVLWFAKTSAETQAGRFLVEYA